MKFVYEPNGVTNRILIDEKWGVETMKNLKKELDSYQNSATKSNKDFDEQLANAEHQKGAIAIPLKADAAKGEKNSRRTVLAQDGLHESVFRFKQREI